MNLGEINKGVVLLIVALLFGAGGYLWYSMLYKPAVAARTTATTAASAAETALTAAEAELEAAKKELEDANNKAKAPDDSVARVQVARKAVPNKKLIDDAAIVLEDLARRTGSTDLRFKMGSEGATQTEGATGNSATGAGGGPSGAINLDMPFELIASYDEMMHFIRLVDSTVVAKDGKLYTQDRLFNVSLVKLSIGDDEADSGLGDMATIGPQRGKDEFVWDITIRMYMSSRGNAESVGSATADPAAAATAGAAGATGAATGTAPAAGATGTPPAGGSTATTGTPTGTTTAPVTTAPTGGGI